MKKSIRNVLCAGALFATLTLTSCGSNNEIKDVEVKSTTTNVTAGDNFDYSGLTLQVTTKDNKKETVKVTEDMIISKPDFSTAGEKEIKIKYKGEEYSIKIYVAPNVNSYYSKLTKLLSQIQNDKTKASEITFQINAKAGANYFGDNFNLISFGENFTLSENDIKDSGLMKALATLGISVDKASIKSENYNLYLVVDKDEFVSALKSILDDYEDVMADIASGIGKGYVADKASIVVDLVVDALGLAGKDVDAEYVKVSLKNVFKSVVKESCDESTFASLIGAICEVKGIDGKQSEKIANAILKNGNWFENSVNLIVESEDFKRVFGTNETVYKAICKSLKDVAVELDNLKNGREEKFAKVVVENMQTIKNAVDLYVNFKGDATAKRLYANFVKYVEPFLTEENINKFIAEVKDLNIEKVKEMFNSFIGDIVSGEITNKIVDAMDKFITSEAGIEVYSTYMAERIEDMLFVEPGSTTLKADIKAFMTKNAQNDYAGEEAKKIVVTIANAMDLDGEFYGNLFEESIIENNVNTTLVDVLKVMGFFNVYVQNDSGDGYDVDEEASANYYSIYRNVAVEMDKENTDATRKVYRAIANLVIYEFEDDYSGLNLETSAIKAKMLTFADELDKFMLKVASTGEEETSGAVVIGEDLTNAVTAFAGELNNFITSNRSVLDADFIDSFDSFVSAFGSYINIDNFNFVMTKLKQYQNMGQDEILNDLVGYIFETLQNGEAITFVGDLCNYGVQEFLKNNIQGGSSIYEESGECKQYVNEVTGKVNEFVLSVMNDIFEAMANGGDSEATNEGEGEEVTTKPTIKERVFTLLDDIYGILSADDVKADYETFLMQFSAFKDFANGLLNENADEDAINSFTAFFGAMLGIDMENSENVAKVAEVVQSLRAFTLSIDGLIANPSENGLITGAYAYTFIYNLDELLANVDNWMDVEEVTNIHRIATSVQYLMPLMAQISDLSNGTIPTGLNIAIAKAILWMVNPYFEEEENVNQYEEILSFANATDALVDTKLSNLQEVVDNYFEELDAFMEKYKDMMDAESLKQYNELINYIKPMFVEDGVVSVVKFLPLLSEASIAEIVNSLVESKDIATDASNLVVGNIVANILGAFADETKENIFVDAEGKTQGYITEITGYINQFYNPMLGINLNYPISGSAEGTHTVQEVITAFKNDVFGVLRRDEVASNFVNLSDLVDLVDVVVDGIFNKNMDAEKLETFKALVAEYVKIKEVDGVKDANSIQKLNKYIDNIRAITTVVKNNPVDLAFGANNVLNLFDKILQETENDFDAEIKYQIHKYSQTYGLMTNLVTQLDKVFNGNIPTGIYSAIVKIYSWAIDADRITDADQKAYLEAVKDLAKAFDGLTAKQIGEFQKAVSDFVKAVEDYAKLCGENLSEEDKKIVAFVENVLKPLTESGVISKVTSYLPLLQYDNIASLYNNVLKGAFSDLQNGDNSTLVKFGVRNLVAGMLVPFANNEYAIMDDFEEIQPDVEELLNYVTDFVLSEEKNSEEFVSGLITMLQSDYFAENFEGIDTFVTTINAFTNLVTGEGEVSNEDKQVMAGAIFGILGFTADAGTGEELIGKITQFITDVTNSEDRISAIIVGLDKLLQENANEFDEGIKQYLHMIAESYKANNNYESVSNFFKLALSADEDLTEQEKEVIIKMGKVIDYYDAEKPEASNVDVLELISMPGFTDILTNKVGISKETATLARILMYVLIDVDEEAGQVVDYNELMKDIEIPSDYASVDYNELIAKLKAQNLDTMLQIDDAKITTEENEQGDIVSEKVTFKVKFNFDALVGNVYADLDIDMILNFEDVIQNA